MSGEGSHRGSLHRADAYDALVIESTANPRIKSIRKLHTPKGRKQAGLTLLEGPNGLEALRSSGIRPVDILMLAEDDAAATYAASVGVEPILVTPNVLRAASDTQHPLGPLCVIKMPSPRGIEPRRTVCLVDIADPGNVGTIIRTAAALEWEVAVCGATADPWSPKALRASAGATLRTPVARTNDPLEDAASAGLACIALVVSGGAPPRPHGEPVLLLVGSEAHGLPPRMVSGGVDTVTLPMAGGIESLNAAVAAAIAMYALD